MRVLLPQTVKAGGQFLRQNTIPHQQRSETALRANPPMFIMCSPEPDAGNGPRRCVEVYLEVDDVCAYHEHVTARGEKAADPLTDQWRGGRTFVVQAPNHCRVWYQTNVAAAHEEGLRPDAGEEQSHDRRAGRIRSDL